MIHALGAGHSYEARIQWWRDLESLIAAHFQASRDLVILGDWNLTFGSITSEAIGPCHAESEGPCAWVAREMLQRLQLFCPSTFTSFAKGEQQWTHVGIKGDCRRIDFIAAPLRWLRFPMVAAVDSDIDLSLAVEDHFVVRLLVSARPPLAAPAWVERRPRLFDAAQLSDPAKAAHFVDLLASAPACPWQFYVRSHAHGLTSFIVGALASSFPLAHKVVAKKREFLSASTLLLVRAKRDFRRLASRARSLTLRHPLIAPVASLLHQMHSFTAVGFNRVLKAALKVDRTSFACAQASSIADSLLGACPRAAAVAVRVAKAFGSRSKRVLPLLEDASGAVAADPLAARRIWASPFFAT